jgi:hypothetical protein
VTDAEEEVAYAQRDEKPECDFACDIVGGAPAGVFVLVMLVVVLAEADGLDDVEGRVEGCKIVVI